MESAQDIFVTMRCSQESNTDLEGFDVDTCPVLSDVEASLSTEHVSMVVTSDASDNTLHGAPPTSAAGSVTTHEGQRALQPPQKKRKTRELFIEELGHVEKELTTCAKDIDENFAATLVDHMRTVKPELKLDMQLKLLQVVKEFQTPAH
ncbi:hypothetical protein HPB52_021732 [Rhipicephalus sanguineus]|uniref:BESS domain-containing protein n=1 Tax=Rhipicephalus sanguineus TaxID=34632 RepID=A0A9D4T4G2_RHISA|nr:hypothetical protein HPB52_021732 [Rhipicephalus sanguineus]